MMNLSEIFASKGINFWKLKSPNVHGVNFGAPPPAPGVYFLSRTRFGPFPEIQSQAIVYVGCSANLEKRYKNHDVINKLRTANDHIGFFFLPMPNSKTAQSVERKLIRMIGPEFNSHKYLFARRRAPLSAKEVPYQMV